MSAEPQAIRDINDMLRHLRNSIVRNHGIVTRSMEDMTIGMLSHWFREKLAGNDCIRPGIAQAAKWGRCSERQAQRNLRQLEQWGVVCVVADGDGGRSMRPAMTIHIDMLLRALTALAMKMSKSLIAKIHAFFEGANEDVKGDKKGDTVSPAYIEDTQKENSTASPARDGERLGPLRSALLASVWGRYQAPRRSKRLNSPTREWMTGEDRPFNPSIPGRGAFP